MSEATLQRDPNSLSNIGEVTTKHTLLDLYVDFDRKVVHGWATLKLEALTNGVTTVTLDTRGLKVLAAQSHPDRDDLPFSWGKEHDIFGTPLTVGLGTPLAQGQTTSITVQYETSPDASGLQWLEPEQTDGKECPYLFAQFQAIHARSFLPCQDAPSVRSTYEARLTVSTDFPKPMVALMSGTSIGSEETALGKSKTFKLQQKVAIPAYLLCIVVGNLSSKKIGPISSVWTEAPTLDAAASEFADTNDFIEAGSAITGVPYKDIWGTYDLLVLPGSFPYGGMEIPNLTLVTPTLLAGDRSLANVVAHEIAHSWTGNLITNETWEHFWLNEGFTVFLERKIIGRMHGSAARHFDILKGNKALVDAVASFGAEHPATALVVNQDGVDPDDTFSSIPYEKGSQFLFYLESLVGEETFEAWLGKWVQENAYGTVNSERMRTFFTQSFPKEAAQVDWDTWFHAPGLPPVSLESHNLDTSLADAAIFLAQRWAQSGDSDATADDLKGWSSGQVCLFLDRLLQAEPGLSLQAVRRVDELYDLNTQKNSEIRFRWYMLCIASENEDFFPGIVEFLAEQGRMKFTRPLYKALHKSQKGSKLAATTFERLRSTYHPICAKMVAKDISS